MQAEKYSIKEWASDDRPREKLLSKSPNALSDSELLAILINNGTKERTALDLAKEILLSVDCNLTQLGKLGINDLRKIKGIGTAKAVTISAALELGRRRQAISPLDKPTIRDSQSIGDYMRIMLQDNRTEVFAVIFLNRANKVNHFEIISRGGITGTVADPRIIMKKALEEDAVNIILCHNHPSGNLQPSKADEDLTVKIKTAASYFDIKVIDHIIVSDQGYFSFADEGMI